MNKPQIATALRTLAVARGSADKVRLQIAMDALSDIVEMPRSGRAGRLAKAVLRFLENVKPVSMSVRRIDLPNARHDPVMTEAITKPDVNVS